MTPSGIEPATCRFVAQCLNHYATARHEARYIQLKVGLYRLFFRMVGIAVVLRSFGYMYVLCA